MIARIKICTVLAMILQVVAAMDSLAGVVVPETGATWVTHPDEPGPNVPPVGRSLFDRLFAIRSDSGLEYKIPFPIEALISHLESAVVNHEGKPVSHVMIPIGRSLQRAAAAPEYFRYPRHLVSVHGEIRDAGDPAGIAGENRLFVAYQEKARQLEVISYNDDAGRFEFQVVHNYDADMGPIVEYTSRSTCMSCHQNGGPIFAKSPWDESNFNAGVASAIAGARPEKYGSMLDAIGFDAAIMDLATNYANYLGASQLIWQQGCGDDLPETKSGVRCRAGFFNAMLQYRLSGKLGFDIRNPAWADMKHRIAEQWPQRWPGGLLIPSADIPDVNPFDAPADDPSLDPLTPRDAAGYWLEPGEFLLRGLVEQQSSSLVSADVRKLDSHLVALSKSNNEPTQIIETECSLTSGPRDAESWQLILGCQNPDKLLLDLDLKMKGNAISNVVVRLFRLPNGEAAWNTGFVDPLYQVSKQSASVSSGMLNTRTGLSARLTNGNRLHRIHLDWDPDQLENPGNKTTARVTLWITEDYSPLEQAIDRLSRDTVSGHIDSLSSLPFRRQAVMPQIYRYMGLE